MGHQELWSKTKNTCCPFCHLRKGGEDYAAVLFDPGIIHARNGNLAPLHTAHSKIISLAQTKLALVSYEVSLRGVAEVALAWRAKNTADQVALETHLRQAALMSK
jgi:hypothetical protein